MFKNVLITGGAGFIGSQLVLKLLPLCTHIYIIDDLSTGHRESIPKNEKITFHQGSITDTELLKTILPEVDYIFHLACSNLIKSVANIEHDFYTNLYGSLLLLDYAHKYCKGLKKFIYTSTTSMYSEAEVLPTSEDYYNIKLPYAASKFSAEHYCDVYNNMYGLPVCTLRLSNVFGPGQTTSNPYCGVVAKFFEASQLGKPLVIYGDGEQTRDFTYIQDVLDAIIICATSEKATGQVYNIGTGVETPIIDLANIIKSMANKNLTVEYEDKRPIDIVKRRSIDASKIKNELSWEPRHSVYQGLTKTYMWLLSKTYH